MSDYGTVTNNGFTGHEHLDDVYLIQMNGRMYDYRLGRFLSVDPIISNPASSRSINPYSYIGNNPLSGVDPTGYEWNLLTSALEYVDSFIGTSVSTPSGNGATGRSPTGGSFSDAESPSAVSKDTNWGAVATGAVFGTLQAIVPGGVLAGSPAPTNPDFEAGRAAGLIASGTVQAVVGGAEAVAGAGVGVVTSPTGVGAVAGGAVAVAGAVVVVQGVANVIVGAAVAAHAMEMRGSGDGGGSTGGKEAAANRAENTAKGIPESRLGPSGEPKIHNVEHSTKKAAQEAAKQEGKGAPIKHSSTDDQPSHFHPTDADGDKIPGVHHNYPD